MPPKINQTPEQIARDKIDKMLHEAGWVVQSKNKIDLFANSKVREYHRHDGPRLCIVCRSKIAGVIEAKEKTKDID